MILLPPPYLHHGLLNPRREHILHLFFIAIFLHVIVVVVVVVVVVVEKQG